MRQGQAGVWDLPLVLVLGVILITGVAVVGIQGTRNLGRLTQEQAAQDDFNHLIEAFTKLASGISDELVLTVQSESSIGINGSIAWLAVNGDNLRVELLPLPAETKMLLNRGAYSLSLVDENGTIAVSFGRL